MGSCPWPAPLRSSCPGPIPRRAVVSAGTLGVGGMTLADLLRARAHGAATPRQTSAIFVWLHGGPPHLETYDTKPLAPAEIRGAFRPIPTDVSGIEVCEHFPFGTPIAELL